MICSVSAADEAAQQTHRRRAERRREICHASFLILYGGHAGPLIRRRGGHAGPLIRRRFSPRALAYLIGLDTFAADCSRPACGSHLLRRVAAAARITHIFVVHNMHISMIFISNYMHAYLLSQPKPRLVASCLRQQWRGGVSHD